MSKRNPKQQIMPAWYRYTKQQEEALPLKVMDIYKICNGEEVKDFEKSCCILFQIATTSRINELFESKSRSILTRLFLEAGYPRIVYPAILRKNVAITINEQGEKIFKAIVRVEKTSDKKRVLLGPNNEGYSLKEIKHTLHYCDLCESDKDALLKRYKQLTKYKTKVIELIFDEDSELCLLLQAIEQYLEAFDIANKHLTQEQIGELPLFPTTSYNIVLAFLIKKLNITTHTLRRISAEFMRSMGYDLWDIMESGGWQSPLMPQVYLSKSRESRLDKQRKFIQKSKIEADEKDT